VERGKQKRQDICERIEVAQVAIKNSTDAAEKKKLQRKLVLLIGLLNQIDRRWPE